MRSTWTPGLLAAALVGAFFVHGASVLGTAQTPTAQVIDSHVYGMPQAEVFQEDYAGPPIVGDAVTLLPNIASLAPGNRTHNIRLDVVAKRIEVAPAVHFDAWTFGGVVPGPVLHVREGDLVVFTMKNRTGESISLSEPVSESSEFASLAQTHHAEDVDAPDADGPFNRLPCGDGCAERQVSRGAARRNHTVPVDRQLSGRLYVSLWCAAGADAHGDGRVRHRRRVAEARIRDRRTRCALVCRRAVGILFKAYRARPHVLDWDAAQRKVPSHVTFNGHVNALKDQPLVANAGERVRLYVHNVGPNDGASTHVVGTIFDRVWYEGNPFNEWRGMQTVPLGASSGAVIEFIVPEEGDYFLVDHAFADAQKGAVGVIRVRSKTGELTRVSPPMKH